MGWNGTFDRNPFGHLGLLIRPNPASSRKISRRFGFPFWVRDRFRNFYNVNVLASYNITLHEYSILCSLAMDG
jgi:hypothetical protein